MKFLGTRLDGVVAPICVKSVVTHDQWTDEDGSQTCEQQDHEPGEDLPRFETLRHDLKWALGVGRIADGRNSPVCARQAFRFPAGGKSKRLVVRYISYDSVRQTRARPFNRILGEERLVGALELARAFPYRDSTGWTADPDGVGDGRDGALTGFVLAQAMLQELEPDVFLGFYHHVSVVHAAVQEMRSTHDRDERSDGRNRGVRFFCECRCIQLRAVGDSVGRHDTQPGTRDGASPGKELHGN